MTLRLLYAQRQHDPSWNVITAMARLLATLLEAEFVVVPALRTRNSLELLCGHLPRRRGQDQLLMILPEPVDLQSVIQPHHWLKGYDHIAAWVTDAWWVDRIPHVARQGRHFDLLYVTEEELVDPWSDRTHSAVAWLPQGTDALDLGSDRSDRDIDLLRVGRQPHAWEDDVSTGRLAATLGLSFAGRPPMLDDPGAATRSLSRAMSAAKHVLAFSNRVSPASYTHPTREYLTGRWTDALGAGATVAGVAPNTSSVRRLLWPEATIEVDPTDVPGGLDVVARASASWTGERARTNHLMALRRLDWRWRAQQIAKDLGRGSATLTAELARLQARIDVLSASG